MGLIVLRCPATSKPFTGPMGAACHAPAEATAGLTRQGA
jgi:trehalose utilization protein